MATACAPYSLRLAGSTIAIGSKRYRIRLKCIEPTVHQTSTVNWMSVCQYALFVNGVALGARA